MERITSCIVLLFFFLNVECFLFNGQINATSASSGQSNIDVDSQIHHLQTVLDSVLMETQRQQTRMSFLENELKNVQIENRIMKSEIDNSNSTTTFLLQQNAILKEELNSLNTTCMGIQRNMTTPEDIRRLTDVLTFEMDQTIRDGQRKLMMNMSATIKDLQVRDRYLSLSVLDVHNETATLKSSLEEHQKSTKLQIQNSSLSMYNEIAKVNDSLSNLRSACTGSNVAFTAGASTHTYTEGHTVIFSNVVYQVGGGYNPTTGVFTAPKPGLYLIFCTVVSNRGHNFWTTIRINGSIKAGVMLLNPPFENIYQSASNLVMHRLQTGDRVWIQLYYGDMMYSSVPDSTFSVTLINDSE